MLRHAGPDDRPTLIALALAEDAAWSGASPVSEAEAGDLIDAYPLGVLVEDAGQVVGYAAVDAGGGTLLAIDPAVGAGPVLAELVPWLEVRGGREVASYARDAQRRAWLQAQGFAEQRAVFDLHRALEPPLPPATLTVAVDPYRPGVDDEAVHALIIVDADWASVPGHTARPLDAWRSLFGPEHRGWVARRDGRPIGWVIGRVFDDGRGWIQQLAVARDARGNGLGRGLLLHALADLQAAGATSFALGVQGENASAIALYRDIGFTVEREWRAYARA
jgi:ribosomal protein S18 acetylase RimI-like enzyme